MRGALHNASNILHASPQCCTIKPEPFHRCKQAEYDLTHDSRLSDCTQHSTASQKRLRIALNVAVLGRNGLTCVMMPLLPTQKPFAHITLARHLYVKVALQASTANNITLAASYRQPYLQPHPPLPPATPLLQVSVMFTETKTSSLTHLSTFLFRIAIDATADCGEGNSLAPHPVSARQGGPAAHKTHLGDGACDQNLQNLT